jgi:hypothetical protein
VETVLSMRTLVSHVQQVMHRVWAFFHPGSRASWPPFLCWSNGMAYGPTRLVSYPSRELSLVCKTPISQLGLSATTTIGYEVISQLQCSWASYGP